MAGTQDKRGESERPDRPGPLEAVGAWGADDDRPLSVRLRQDGDALKPDKLRAALVYLAQQLEGEPEHEGADDGTEGQDGHGQVPEGQRSGEGGGPEGR